MSVDIEILGGPLDGHRWVDEKADGTEFGKVRFGDSTRQVMEMDAIPSPTRSGVVLALWSTRKLIPETTWKWNRFFLKGEGGT